MNKKPKADQTSKKSDLKESDECCPGGYGYMKRRLGLLSFEADKLNDKIAKPDPKEM